MIDGKEIKLQAGDFFSAKSMNLNLLVSDKRTYFPCSTPLDFQPRLENDWSTIIISCVNENWSTLIRSTASGAKSFQNFQNNQISDFVAVVLSKNLSKGQVIIPNWSRS